MNQKSTLNHVALLVEKIEPILAKKLFDPALVGRIESFESEGTREVYIGAENQSGKVLLMEPIAEGPYQKALKKRGPGLHHIALDVDDVTLFCRELAGSGWYLHPKSLDFFQHEGFVFLARPGGPTLIEVQKKKGTFKSSLVQSLSLSFPTPELAHCLGCAEIGESDQLRIVLEDRTLTSSDFFD